jgi:hypothetical protein
MRRRLLRNGLLGALATASGLAARAVAVSTPEPVPAPSLTLRPGDSLAELLARARDGDVLELAEGLHRGQAASIAQRRLTLRGAGRGAVLQADGAHAEGKALLVVRDGDIRIENIVFRGARVPDGNGAGIRFERGRLHAERCGFEDNQNGILTANFAEAELSLSDCRFDAAPAGTPLPHLLYVGRIAQLEIRRCRFGGGRGGHLLKSRAAVNEVSGCDFDDGPAGEAAYELDFPEGGAVRVLDCRIVQSPQTRNRTMLAFGAEAARLPRGLQRPHRLELRRNHFVNRHALPANFVRIFDEQLAAAPVVLAEGNRFEGLGAVDPRLQPRARP